MPYLFVSMVFGVAIKQAPWIVRPIARAIAGAVNENFSESDSQNAERLAPSACDDIDSKVIYSSSTRFSYVEVRKAFLLNLKVEFLVMVAMVLSSQLSQQCQASILSLGGP